MKRSVPLLSLFLACRVGLILLLCCQLEISAESRSGEKLRIAVVELKKTGDDLPVPKLGSVINEWLTAFLVNTNLFEVIERQALDKVLEEQSLGQSGAIDSESAAKAGELLGVDVLVTGTVIYVGDEFEVTARLIDTTNGTIVGMASVSTDDEDELRDKIERLAEMIGGKLLPTSEENGMTIFEGFEGDALPTRHWRVEFGEDVTRNDQEETTVSLQDGLLQITGTYYEDDDGRSLWFSPIVGQSHRSFEMKTRVRDIQGGASICLYMDWDREEHWTGLCLYVEEDYSDLGIDVDDVEEATIELGVQLNQWNVIGIEYRDAAFHYYWNKQLMKSITPEIPPLASEHLSVGAFVLLTETRTMMIDIDEISLR